MILDVTLPAEYSVGTIHSEGIRALGKTVTFEVVGWYINHHKESGIMRYIKDGNALAIREVDPSVIRTKMQEKKRESSRIQLAKPERRYRSILRLKGKPATKSTARDSAKAMENLIKIGLLSPEEANDIFSKKSTSNRDKLACHHIPNSSKVIDLFGGHDPSKTDVFD